MIKRKSKLNICLVSAGYPPQDGGGIGTYSHNLAKGLVQQGHKVTVITRGKGEDVSETLDGVNVCRYKYRYFPKIERLIPGLTWSIFVAKKIFALDEKEKFDVVEFPNWEGVGFAYLLTKKRKPVVTRLHTPYFETLSIDSQEGKISVGDRFICWMEKKACQRSDQLVSSTECHREMMTRNYELQQKETNIVPLGIDLVASPNGTAKQSKNKMMKVLYVSRLENRKGTLTLIHAIPKIIKKFRKVEFIFVGKDRPHAPGGKSYRDYFLERFGEYKDQVQFWGFVSNEELEQFYRECDIFAVPSVYESFGLIYVEAMMHGKPVIGCKAGGIPEVVENNQTGILTDPENVDQLVDAVCKLLKDEKTRLAMGQQARKLVERKFTYELMAERTADLYKKTAGMGNGKR